MRKCRTQKNSSRFFCVKVTNVWVLILKLACNYLSKTWFYSVLTHLVHFFYNFLKSLLFSLKMFCEKSTSTKLHISKEAEDFGGQFFDTMLLTYVSNTENGGPLHHWSNCIVFALQIFYIFIDGQAFFWTGRFNFPFHSSTIWTGTFNIFSWLYCRRM